MIWRQGELSPSQQFGGGPLARGMRMRGSSGPRQHFLYMLGSASFSGMAAGGNPTFSVDGPKRPGSMMTTNKNANKMSREERIQTLDILSVGAPREDDAPRLQVRGYGNHCFQVNETLVHGSVFLLPKTFFMWKVKSVEDITIESLSVFQFVYPRLEVLFIGMGARMSGPLDPAIAKHFRSRGIIVEASDSANAAATYNVMNGEGRNVAAALFSFDEEEEEEA